MRTTRTLPSNLRLFGLVLCGLVLSACSQESETFHENGQLRSRNTISREEVHGVFERFYENGQLAMRENWITRKDEGGSILDLLSEWTTSRQKDGLSELFHENGKLGSRGNYKPDSAPFPDNIGGLKDGLWEWFDENGQLKSRQNYKDGEPDGLWEWFHENGQLWRRENYKPDPGPFPDNIGGLKDGLWEWFHEDGNLIKTETYKDGELVEENPNP